MRLNKSKQTSTNLYCKFLGFLTKKGNKLNARKVLDKAFFNVSKKLKMSREKALVLLFSQLNSFVEVKKIRVRRKIVFVPFPISFKRRSYLIVKWVIDSTKREKKRSPLHKKLAKEIANVLEGSKSRSQNLRRINFSKALENKSNAHFRW
jgi:ribosomal protein S7